MKQSLRNSATAITLMVLSVFYIFPFFWLVSTALKTVLEANTYPPVWLPQKPQWDNFRQAWALGGFSRFTLNSVIVTFVTILGQAIVCVPAAYAFSKKQFRMKKFLFGIILFDMMVPGQATFIQTYILLSRANLINTYAALTVPFFYSAFAIFFMSNAFKQVSDELIDAARMDNATEKQIIFNVLFPIVRPTVITLAMFTFIGKWNDYFWTLILTTTDRVRTLPMAVNSIIDSKDGLLPAWNISMAANLMLIAPLLIIYVIANRKIKQAFMYQGIK